MSVNGAYHRTEEEFGAEPPRAGAAATREHRARAHSYEEAISLAGTGGYTRGLLACLSLTILSMGADMFGFSVVVAGASCDLRVSAEQRSLLMSMPFAGAIVMSYPWGYFSDTRGRRRCLLLAMAGGCAASTLGAFSPHWAVLAVLKFISTSCCSCAQSVTYALLGESSPARARGGYMLTMTAVLMLTPAFYFGGSQEELAGALSPDSSVSDTTRRKDPKWRTSRGSTGAEGAGLPPPQLLSAQNESRATAVISQMHIKQQLPLKLASGKSQQPPPGYHRLHESPSELGTGLVAHHTRAGSSPAPLPTQAPVNNKAARTNTYPKLPDKFRVTPDMAASPAPAAPAEEEVIYF